MSNMPVVSILIPVYNVEAYLPQCLDSVIGQTYMNLQIVVIDDGSTDKSWEIMQEYAQKDNRIEIYHQDNAGVATTRNNLLEKIKGEYFLFIDSDDWMELNMVESMLALQQDSNVDIVICSIVNEKGYQHPQQKPARSVHYTQSEIIKEFCKHTWLSGSLWNKLISASLLHDIKFYSEISYGEDALFCWNILQYVDRGVLVTNSQFYHYRMNNDSISHQLWTPEKKGSNTIVWHTIVKECEKEWPQYADIAKARCAIEDMWGLYFAAISSYPYDEHIKSRQINVRRNLSLIRKSRLINYKKIIAAYILSYSYRLGSLLRYV